MANPGDLLVLVLRDRVDSLVKTIGEFRVRLEAAEERIAVLQAIRRIDDHLVIRDSMNASQLGGGK